MSSFINILKKVTTNVEVPKDDLNYKEFAIMFKALSDETRLHIVDMLSCKEMTASDLLANFTISQSTLSYHIKILTQAHILRTRKNGLWCYYSINDTTFSRLMDFLPALYKLKDKCLCTQTKYIRNTMSAEDELSAHPRK